MGKARYRLHDQHLPSAPAAKRKSLNRNRSGGQPWGLTQIPCRFDISTLCPANSTKVSKERTSMSSKAWDSSLRLPGLIVESRAVIDGIVEMSGRLAAAGGNCPDCAMPSATLHSRYDRRVGRCEALVRAVAVASGGRPGSRMMARLSARWSRDTMLRVLRCGDPAAVPPPPARVVGIDDFEWRPGHSYRSIVVDLEGREDIDLLPDRQRATVIAWLRQNPQVKIICRDRSPGYGAAASEAAPQA